MSLAAETFEANCFLVLLEIDVLILTPCWPKVGLIDLSPAHHFSSNTCVRRYLSWIYHLISYLIILQSPNFRLNLYQIAIVFLHSQESWTKMSDQDFKPKFQGAPELDLVHFSYFSLASLDFRREQIRAVFRLEIHYFEQVSVEMGS